MPVYLSDHWKVSLPDGWGVVSEDALQAALGISDEDFQIVQQSLKINNTVILAKRDGAGALHIGCTKRPSGTVTEQDLTEAAGDSIAAGVVPRQVETKGLAGIVVEYAEQDALRREWFLRKDGAMVTAAYDCDLDAGDPEAEEVASIVASMELL